MNKNDRLLRMGVLGCGPIAQMAHLDVCRKACNTELYAICDVAEDHLQTLAAERPDIGAVVADVSRADDVARVYDRLTPFASPAPIAGKGRRARSRPSLRRDNIDSLT